MTDTVLEYARNGGNVLLLADRDGSVCVCTVRVTEAYGNCPVTTVLLEELLATSLESSAPR